MSENLLEHAGTSAGTHLFRIRLKLFCSNVQMYICLFMCRFGELRDEFL